MRARLAAFMLNSIALTSRREQIDELSGIYNSKRCRSSAMFFCGLIGIAIGVVPKTKQSAFKPWRTVLKGIFEEAGNICEREANTLLDWDPFDEARFRLLHVRADLHRETASYVWHVPDALLKDLMIAMMQAR
jgi:hypothetical protein